MKIKLKKIKVLEPKVKIEAGFRTINGDIPSEKIIGTSGQITMIFTGAGTGIVGNAIEIND